MLKQLGLKQQKSYYFGQSNYKENPYNALEYSFTKLDKKNNLLENVKKEVQQPDENNNKDDEKKEEINFNDTFAVVGDFMEEGNKQGNTETEIFGEEFVNTIEIELGNQGENTNKSGLDNSYFLGSRVCHLGLQKEEFDNTQLINNKNNNYNILSDNQSQNQYQPQQNQTEYENKIQELQKGIEEMKKKMENYGQQLKDIEQVKEQKSQQNSCTQLLERDQINILEESKDEKTIQNLKQQVLEQRAKPIRKQKKQKVFQCQEPNCTFTSNKKIEVSRHFRKCHKYGDISLELSCKFCQQRFLIGEARDRHVKVHHHGELQQMQQQQEQQQEKQEQQNEKQQKLDDLLDDSLFGIKKQVSYMIQ